MKYDAELKRLEGVYRESLQFKDEQIEQYKRENTNLWGLVNKGIPQEIRNITIVGNTIQGTAYAKELKGSSYTEGDNRLNPPDLTPPDRHESSEERSPPQKKDSWED